MSRISIIVPTYNRPARLAECLRALAQLHYPRNGFEVIVVDDGGDADLDSIVGSMRDNLALRIVRQRNTGPAGARNTGAAHAAGEFIAFTDDDCAPEAEWLRLLMDRLQQDPSRMYGGHTVNALEDNIYSGASQALIDYLYGYYNARPDRARFFASNNMAMARSLFESSGGFDTRFPGASGEDRDLCDRWLQEGHGMCFVPEARVRHAHQLTLRTFWKQHFNYGTGAWQFRKSKQARGLAGPELEPLRFYLDLLSHAWKHGLDQPLRLSLLLALSQAANALGFGWAALRGDGGRNIAGRQQDNRA